VAQDVAVSDRRLARPVRGCHELGGQELFGWTDPDGRVAAAQLGNIRAACRSSYVRPQVPEAHADGSLAHHGPPAARGRTGAPSVRSSPCSDERARAGGAGG
jgi:DNA topoisomerase IB